MDLLKQFNLSKAQVILALFLFSSCAGIRDSKLGKFYNNVTARYNGYFNAKELVLESERTIKDAHIDDFTQILDIYRWGDESTGKSQASSMDKAIEKCSNVIQKHEGSAWIDDAYFTVAEAYFYKGEYYAALDLFKYLASEYRDSDMELVARLWIVKTYIQMNKDNDALAYLSTIQNEKKEFKDYETEIDLINAHLKIKVNNLSDAALSLERAIPEVKNRKERNRYRFILAQLYEAQGNSRRANEEYSALLKKSMPYEFQFQTRLKVAKSTNLQNRESVEKVVKSFKKLLNDDNNRDYFDQIHFEIANVYLRSGNQEKAIEHYKISAWLGEKNLSQKANTYLALGDLYFEEDLFVIAGSYYDSCASIIPETHPKYKEILKQKDILNKLIVNLQTIKTQDSLQQLASLAPDEIEKLIDKKLANEELAKQKLAEKEEKKKQRNELRENLSESSIANAPNMLNNSSDWYFDNPVTIGKGVNDFKVKWGTRKLEDNWRRSQKTYVFVADENSDSANTTAAVKKDSVLSDSIFENLPNELEDKLKNIDESKKEYFTNIPFLPSQKRASDNLIIEALYENGLIYFEQLADYKSAINSFEKLLKDFPGSKFEAAANFYLFKIYQKLEDEKTADIYKNNILSNFPTSQYAQLILGQKNTEEVQNNPILERYYALAYNYYEIGNCDSVIGTYKTVQKLVDDNYLQDKFMFLQTLCKGKNLKTDSFILALENFVAIYKTSDIAKEARNLIRYLKANKPKEETETVSNDSTEKKIETIAKKEFIFKYDEAGEFYFLLSAKQDDLKSEKVKSEIANYNIKYHRSDALSVRSLEFENGEVLFWVKTFPSIDKAQKYFGSIQTDETFKTASKLEAPLMFYISAENFKLLISEQNTKDYIEFFDLYFLKKEN